MKRFFIPVLMLLLNSSALFGAFDGTLSVIGHEGGLWWQQKLPGNVMNVAYGNAHGKDIVAAGLINGKIWLFNEGATPYSSSGGEINSYQCNTCNSQLHFVEQYQRWYCDKCQKYV